ncbi:MAG: pantoate--beta-alanine ligase [Bacteroidota bacterium]
MLLFKKVADLQDYLQSVRKKGQSIGFVPTMGALHEGHLSLFRRAKSQHGCVVGSIFVNPTQFNDARDLEKYPRTTEQDILMLNGVKCDVLFMPPANEVYPPGLDTTLRFDWGGLDRILEGEFRPGHFEGMAQVVKRLLDIVRPNALYLGQKDLQQFIIVRRMIGQLGLDIDLVRCPIVRETDGLAMSSRNRRLPAAHRAAAPKIYDVLRACHRQMDRHCPEELEAWALAELQQPDFRPEYFRIVDGYRLQPIKSFADSDFVVICTAVWLGDIRLIDNLILREKVKAH